MLRFLKSTIAVLFILLISAQVSSAQTFSAGKRVFISIPPNLRADPYFTELFGHLEKQLTDYLNMMDVKVPDGPRAKQLLGVFAVPTKTEGDTSAWKCAIQFIGEDGTRYEKREFMVFNIKTDPDEKIEHTASEAFRKVIMQALYYMLVDGKYSRPAANRILFFDTAVDEAKERLETAIASTSNGPRKADYNKSLDELKKIRKSLDNWVKPRLRARLSTRHTDWQTFQTVLILMQKFFELGRHSVFVADDDGIFDFGGNVAALLSQEVSGKHEVDGPKTMPHIPRLDTSQPYLSKPEIHKTSAGSVTEGSNNEVDQTDPTAPVVNGTEYKFDESVFDESGEWMRAPDCKEHLVEKPAAAPTVAYQKPLAPLPVAKPAAKPGAAPVETPQTMQGFVSTANEIPTWQPPLTLDTPVPRPPRILTPLQVKKPK